MPNDKYRSQIQPLLVLLLIAAFYGALHLAGIHCPIRYATGISCPGCGMTRAWISLLRGDFSAALRYHPLCLTMIPAVAAILLRKRIPRRLFSGLVWVLIVLFIAVYLYRMLFSDSGVVVFEPQNGAVYRALSHIRF